MAEEAPLRVRFAPSPTGYLHVGTARTALFNWLHARGRGGRFLLRIEDTDRERSAADFEQALLADLRWLGLDWDEGVEKGGPDAPYRQSERLAIYQEVGRRLLAEGKAYPCFCTREELEAARAADRLAGRAPRYPGRCRPLDAGQAQARREAGEPWALRLRTEPGEPIVIADGLKGEVAFEPSGIEDFVLLRHDGTAQYVFAVVIDDLAMRVTDVIRGEDLLPSTPRQVLVYRALGQPAPRFHHLPMVLGPDHAKLSKRHGAVAVGDYREQGFLPEAVINAVALLGWPAPEGREVMGLRELVESFRLERVGRSNAIFDLARMRWLNGQHLRRLTGDELLRRARAWLERAGLLEGEPGGEERPWLEQALLAAAPSSELLADLVARVRPVFGWPEGGPGAEALAAIADGDAALLLRMAELLESGTSFHDALEQLLAASGLPRKKLLRPLRAALTGETSGLELGALVPLAEQGSRIRAGRILPPAARIRQALATDAA